MKAVILAGGFGSRISEESHLRPKPMIEVGGRPILWHIMKIYSHYGINDFVILLGYKSYVIKEYFANYFLHHSDVTIDTANNRLDIHCNKSENWRITLVETGLNTMTGGRIKNAQQYIGNEPFLLTYGDGVSNVDINKLIEYHKQHKKILTLTAILPEGRFGALTIENDDTISHFIEKPQGDGAWMNGGFFVCEPKIFDYITQGNETIFERGPMEQLAREGQLVAYKHRGFWKCMDTLRDQQQLDEMWTKGNAPWKLWS